MKKVDLSNFPFSRYTNFTYTNYVIDLEVSDYDKAERTGFIEKSKLKDYKILNKFYANECVIEKTYSRESDDRYMFSHDSDMKSDTSDIFAGII